MPNLHFFQTGHTLFKNPIKNMINGRMIIVRKSDPMFVIV